MTKEVGESARRLTSCCIPKFLLHYIRVQKACKFTNSYSTCRNVLLAPVEKQQELNAEVTD